MLALTHSSAVTWLAFVASTLEEAAKLDARGLHQDAKRMRDSAHAAASVYVSAYQAQEMPADHQNERVRG